MSHPNYYNQKGDIIYALHFPGTGLEMFKDLVTYNETRRIKVSSNISIISIMNSPCWKDSPLRKQCENNGIKIINDAQNEYAWKNTLKIQHILNCLDTVETDYALVSDGKDVIISHDLDEEFICKYDLFDKGIVYNGTPVAYPKAPIEPLQELFQINGKQKFLNAGLCFGKVCDLKLFYKVCAEINDQDKSNTSEQLVVRKARQARKDLVAIDHNNELFRICHKYDTVIKKEADKIILI